MRHTMPRDAMRLGVAALVLSQLGCSDLSDNWADPYTGTWTLAVAAGPGCPDGFTLLFDIDRDDAATANDDLFNIVSTWTVTALSGETTGNVNRAAPSFAIEFHHIGGTTLFAGGNHSPTDMVGTFTDTPGMFCSAGFSASAAATR
jgi:hypothetical protein